MIKGEILVVDSTEMKQIIREVEAKLPEEYKKDSKVVEFFNAINSMLLCNGSITFVFPNDASIVKHNTEYDQLELDLFATN